MQRQRRLAVLVGREVLRHSGRDGLVTRHDALDQAAHGLNPQGQGDHIEQQQIIAGIVPGQLMGRNSCTQCHHFIWIQINQRLASEKAGHRLAHLRHAGRAAHQHHTLNVFLAHFRIAQRLAHSCQCALREVRGGGFKVFGPHVKVDQRLGQLRCERGDRIGRQRLFASPRSALQSRFVGGIQGIGCQTRFSQYPVHQRAVIVVTAEG